MELEEYLFHTKPKREMLIKQASNYLNTIANKEIEIDTSGINNEKLYLGPSPIRLKQFENQVIGQLQKIYKLGLDTQDSNSSTNRKAISINERIKRVYSKQSASINRKQLVILPKQNTGKNIKSIAPINRFMSKSPFFNSRAKKRDNLSANDKLNSPLPQIK